jgi:hypothetical protein
MPKIAYVHKKMGAASLAIIDQANKIITDYDAQGYSLTLRQLYYQFVSRDLIQNTFREYKRIGETVNSGRLAGYIDWDAIEDRTRGLKSLPHWAEPSDIVESAAAQFRIDKWLDQPNYPEVWIEKDALSGVFSKVCHQFDVPYLSCRGYTSQSEMWAAAMRLEHAAKRGRLAIVLHFGDHDPSGLDMTRDIQERLDMFCRGHVVDVRRMALTMEQVEKYDPPPNFAKQTDARFRQYESEFGDKSWELDALEPKVLAELVEKSVKAMMNTTRWKAAENVERAGRQRIEDAAEEMKQ